MDDPRRPDGSTRWSYRQTPHALFSSQNTPHPTDRRMSNEVDMSTIGSQQANSRGLPPVGKVEARLERLGLALPRPPEPFGIYAEAVQTGSLLFLTGMLPTEGRSAIFVGRIGAELDIEAGYRACRLAALNALAVAQQHLGSLDRIIRVVRLGVMIATSSGGQDQPRVADGASKVLQDVFGADKNPCRIVYGVKSLPLGAPVELELIFEVAP
jgi:enamine deaminase RidA (YjgF/YER057c/UK114 family)